MNQNKLVAWGIVGTLAICVLGAITENTTDSNTYYTIGGLGFWIFGIWSAVILFRSK